MPAFRRILGLTSLLALSLVCWSHLGAQSGAGIAPGAVPPARPALAPAAPSAAAPAIPPGLFKELRWRNIGPFRGGRTKAAVGVASQPNIFYIGAVNGGVWKTTDYGRTWLPIFDDQPTGSIGAIAVAPSNPDVIYVGSGEGMQRPDLSTGDGIYRSTDAGRTWTHLGLRDGQQIAQIDIDPRDPKRLFVAVLGHPYGPNPERGLYRSTDGGATFQSVLYKDEHTGAADVCIDPNTPSVVYAVLWQSQHGPWENASWAGPGSGLFKSTDGGTTWRQLTRGLPAFADGGLGRIGITVAPSDSNRLYATVSAKPELAGLYRSDDAGESWARVNADPRVVARPDDAAEVRVDPRNPDVVFVPTIVAWKSVDGGKTFSGWRGAPGGDDYQRLWINPNTPDTMLLVADQGAIITVNGGQTWSSWYNQPTAQLFHVNTDNAFPYRVCGGQQESGSACVQSRGDDGQITFREWRPVAVEEYGYAVPDPLNPDIVYGGKLTRYDRRTHQAQNVAPRALRGPGYRFVRTAPVVFSEVDPHILYFASNTLWKTADGGQSWAEISPDLTRSTWDVPASVGVYKTAPSSTPAQRGVIYTIAPSPIDAGRIWAGTDDGLIHVTADGGKTWRNVTPPDLKPWAKVSIMDASHFDPLTAFAAIDTMRLDDTRPHLYRTRDGGKTWASITAGIPDGGITRVIREDPKRKGLLFAGTEQAVYVSFDDGDHWQSLRGNMPATSIRDLVIKGDDVVVGTHGRGFWILDDITPLRQVSDAVLSADAHLFAPQEAMRWRWNTWTDTPLPPDEPAGQNPPDGAIIHYHLKHAVSGTVSVEIVAASGAVVRKYSSTDAPEPPVEGRNIPDYWIRPAQQVSTAAGLHRFVWDLHYPAPASSSFEYPISAIYRNTWREPRGPWVLPGAYKIRLIVDGVVVEQPLVVKMDPRVQTPAAGLERQFALSMQMYEDMAKAQAALTATLRPFDELRVAPSTVEGRQAQGVAGASAAALPAVRRAEIERAMGAIESLYGMLQEADLAPTPQVAAAVADAHAALVRLLGPAK
jgi:photosystem II stability/assembly factor-like uncharacterized protein